MILSWLLGLINPLSRLLRTIDNRVDNETERQRIQAETVQAYVVEQAKTIQTGMASTLFWIPWLMAAVPMAAWFGWGMLDSLFNGSLPSVAELPPQLKGYADVVWSNLFLSGGIVAGGSIIAKALRR